MTYATMTKTVSQIYVGTYAKYNAGSIAGAWLDLSDYSSSEEFWDACKALHKDESDPEFMFQDWEGIPEGMISESHLSDDVWEWLELDEEDRELLKVYRANVDTEGTIEQARDAYRGKADTKADAAYDYWEDSGMLSEVPEFARSYIDWDSVARDMEYSDFCFVRHEGAVWVFWRS
jgi:antirestriction protein